MTRPGYQVEATRTHDGWWHLEVPQVPRGRTQSRRLDQAETQVRDMLATLLQVDPTSFDVAVTVTPPAAAVRPLQRLYEGRTRLEQAKAEATAAQRDAARALLDAGLSMRDAGVVLGVSHQRVQQIVNGHAREPARAR